MQNKRRGIVRLPRLLFMIIVLSITFFAFTQDAIAGVTGKIVGTIKDSETGEFLPVANILIVGTDKGAAADEDGYYFVINVPPGTYSVQARMMGYEPVTKTDAVVNVDRTTRVDFDLRPTAIEVPGITIVAHRPIIEEDVSATQILISTEDIATTPVGSITELLAVQAGTYISYNLDEGTGLSIRGGSIGESDFQVNGISLRSELTDVSHMNVPKSAIKEIQLLTGGFNAEYGGIRSGFINTITKEGRFDKYEGSIEIRSSPPALKHFGPDAFDKNGRIWQMYAGPQAFEGTTEEDVELFQRTHGDSGYALVFRGWNAFAAKLAADDDPDNDMTPQQCLELWKYRHRPRSYADEADYDVDASFGGPLPILPKTSFFISYRRENYLLVYPLSRKKEVNETYQLKLTNRIIPEIKLSIDGIYGKRIGCTPAVFGSSYGSLTDNSWGPIAGNISGSRFATEFTADAFTSYGSHSAMYVPAWWSTRDDEIFRLSVKATHILSPSTYYELQYQYGKDWVYVWHLEDRDTTKIMQIGDEWYDETPEGWSTSERYDQVNFAMISGGARYSNRSSNWAHRLKFDFISQFNKYNEAKAGFDLRIPNLKVRSCYYTTTDTAAYSYENNPGLWQYWDAKFLNVSAYIQDKFEWRGMIANFGLRADYLDPRTKAYGMETPYDTYYTRPTFYEDIWYASKQTETVEKRLKLQPRLGVSYPVSINSKFYFNYGHFYKPPNPYYMYSMGFAESGPGFVMPSPNVDWARTIAYEVGYEQNIANMFLIHIAGYYKDISGEFMLITGVDWDHTVRNEYWTNNRYSDIRGIELRIDKPMGEYITFWSNFNYMVRSWGYTTQPSIYENPLEAEAQLANAEQRKPIAVPDFRAGIRLFTPKNWGPGPEILGTKLFGGIKISLLYMWEKGGEFEFDTWLPIEERHWIKAVDYSNTDLKIEKSVSIGALNGKVFMDVYNLFSQKFLYTGGWTTPEYRAYRESLHLPWEEDEQKGNDKWGDWDKEHIDIGWHDWMQFLNPRDIFFGIRFEF